MPENSNTTGTAASTTDETPSATFAITTSQLDFFLKIVDGLPTEPPSLYVDGEGLRGGAVAFLLLHVPPHSATYRIPLGRGQGDTYLSPASTEGAPSIRSVLESSTIPKVTFDVRSLSHSLSQHYGVELAGVRDLQLMELATRALKHSKRNVASLTKCVEQDLGPNCELRGRWLEQNGTGTGTENGTENGRRRARARGRQPAMRRVELFPALWDVYHSKLSRPQYILWVSQVQAHTEKRLAASREPGFDRGAKGAALGPAEWCDPELLKELR